MKDWIRTTNENGQPVDLRLEVHDDGVVLVVDDEPFERMYHLEISEEDADQFFTDAVIEFGTRNG